MTLLIRFFSAFYNFILSSSLFQASISDSSLVKPKSSGENSKTPNTSESGDNPTAGTSDSCEVPHDSEKAMDLEHSWPQNRLHSANHTLHV